MDGQDLLEALALRQETRGLGFQARNFGQLSVQQSNVPMVMGQTPLRTECYPRNFQFNAFTGPDNGLVMADKSVEEMSPKNHRKDLLWKPLMRNFRRFLKKDALTAEQYTEIRRRPYNEQGQLFCRALGVPEEVSADRRCQMAMLIIISSHRIVWKKQVIPVVARLLEQYKDELWPLFFRIFNETSHKKRRVFFREPLIKSLWSLFVRRQTQEIFDYLDSIDQINAIIFYTDIRQIELESGT